MKIHLDFETFSVADLPPSGTDVYSKHPTTEVICLAFAFDDGPIHLWKWGDPPPIDLFLEMERDDVKIYAHNAAFELQIWNNVCVVKLGWPPLELHKLFCTMVMGYAMGLPGKLENLANAINLGIEKDMPGHRIMLQLAQPRSGPDIHCRYCYGDGYNKRGRCSCTVRWGDDPTCTKSIEKYSRTYNYCMNDVEVEREVEKRLTNIGPLERELWLLDQKINLRGIHIDQRAVRGAIRVIEREADRLTTELREVSGNAIAGPSCTGQIKKFLETEGMIVPSIAKNEVTDLLERKDLPPKARRVLEIRKEAAKTSTAKLTRMIEGVSSDGRLKGCFQFNGAITRRWAGRRIQLHNLPRPKIPQKDIEEILELFGGIT